MKKLIFLFLTFICTNLIAQQSFDSTLAVTYGADDYGMKTFVMAFLKIGDEVEKYSAEERAEIQKGHMANIQKLAASGKLILAGPFIEGEELRGIFLFNVSTLEEAREMTATDPAVQAGVLSMELIKWYGSAALTAIPDIHSKIQKKSF